MPQMSKDNNIFFGTVKTAIPVFCILYMLLIFGPSEIFFSNLPEFDFAYQQLFIIAILEVISLTALFTVIISLIKNIRVRNAILGMAMGIMLAIYIQVMFLNKDLDLLGLNPEGYHPGMNTCILNLLIWLILVIACLIASICIRRGFSEIVFYVSLFLILIQTAGLVQLIITADHKAYEVKSFHDEEWTLSGRRQMEIGSEDNVIVLSLDFFSNQYVEPMLEQYPDALDALKDFTYYDNEDCVYFGTFPSIAHMMTGCEVEPDKPINQWMKDIWEYDNTKRFYKEAHDSGYTVLFHEEVPRVYIGDNDIQTLDGIFDNVVKEPFEERINNTKLTNMMYRMSMFRAAPYIFKGVLYRTSPTFNVLDKIDGGYGLCCENYDYYNRLLDEGLHFGDSKKCFTFSHLTGAHDYTTSDKCQYKSDSTKVETCRGCMVLVEEYLHQLKELGKYDDATIIVTTDHGGFEDPQAIFFIKKPNEKHDKYQVSHKPISHCEFLPTIASAMGLKGDYGDTIDDISETASRKRTCWNRTFDENYPVVPYYDSTRDGRVNVYYCYDYETDYEELYEKIKNGPDRIIPMVDSMY